MTSAWARTTSSSDWQSDSMGGFGACDDWRRCVGRGGGLGDFAVPAGDLGLDLRPPLSSSSSRSFIAA
jgi:hypothetical protein